MGILLEMFFFLNAILAFLLSGGLLVIASGCIYFLVVAVYS